ncbi:hypothetical protein BKA70DRAFT_1112962, partial [Coprinopsis sp. MPI-PUGE-AT-0042]
MTSNLVRWVYVDDDDQGIIYQGPWTIHKDDFAQYQSFFGTVYRGSQHQLLKDEGSLTFRFKGHITIVGSSNPANVSGILDPSHTCLVDGVNVPPRETLRLHINLFPWCTTNSTYLGEHVLTLTAVSSSRAFYVDRIAYIPDRSSPPQSPTVAIAHDDLAVKYLDESWNFVKTAGMVTQQPGAMISITFTGSGATFIGNVPDGFPGAKSTATYSINSGPPIPFDVPGLGTGVLPMYRQPLFKITNLGSGIHELIVTYNGPAAPLVFDHLQVEDGDIMQSSLTPGGGGAGGKKAPVGAIVGGAVGGAALLFVLLALILWMRKRKKSQSAQATAAVP